MDVSVCKEIFRLYINNPLYFSVDVLYCDKFVMIFSKQDRNGKQRHGMRAIFWRDLLQPYFIASVQFFIPAEPKLKRDHLF